MKETILEVFDEVPKKFCRQIPDFMSKNKELVESLLGNDRDSTKSEASSFLASGTSNIPNPYLLSNSNFDSFDAQSLDIVTNKEQKFFPTLINLMNSMLGAGILSVPATFTDTGTVVSLICITVIYLLSFYSSCLVISLQRKTFAQSFSELAERSFGHWATITLSVLTLMLLLSLLITFVVVATDILFSWFRLAKLDIIENKWMQAIVVFVYALVLPIALCIPRKITFLTFFSGANIIFVLIFCSVIIYEGVSSLVKMKGINSTIQHIKINLDIFNSMSIYSLSFALACVIIPVIRVYNHDLKKRKSVTFCGMTLVYLMNTLPALICYLHNGANIKSNVLNTYDNKNVVIIVTRGLFFFVVSFAFPLISQTTMATFSTLFFKVPNHNDLTTGKRWIVLCANCCLPLLVPMVFREIKPIVGIGGALGGCLANFTFPAAMYLQKSTHSVWYWKSLCALMFAIFGCICCGIATYTSVVAAMKAFKK